MNSTIEIPIQLEGKLESNINIESTLDFKIDTFIEEPNEYGGTTIIID